MIFQGPGKGGHAEGEQAQLVHFKPAMPWLVFIIPSTFFFHPPSRLSALSLFLILSSTTTHRQVSSIIDVEAITLRSVSARRV